MSFTPWFGLFLAGAATNRLWPQIEGIPRGCALGWFFIYLAIAFPAVAAFGDDVTGDHRPGWLCVVLFCFGLSLGYTSPRLAKSALKRHDASYGLYLFHAPIMKAFLDSAERGLTQIPAFAGAFFVRLVAATMAIASWHLIERPALSFKKRVPVR